jgi:hypothetical protein
MRFAPEHVGLLFSNREITNSRQFLDREPFSWAVKWLHSDIGAVIRERPTPTRENKKATTPIIKQTPHMVYNLPMQNAYRYSILQEEDCAIETINNLPGLLMLELVGVVNLLAQCRQMVALAHLYEMVRPHPHIETLNDKWYQNCYETLNQPDNPIKIHPTWHEQFIETTHALLNIPSDDPLDLIWQNTLSLSASVVLDNAEMFEQSVQQLKGWIERIHPEGYIIPLSRYDIDNSFNRMFFAASGLALSAEISTQAGENIWDFENRGVGVQTAVTYMFSYYYYPDQWRWASNINPNDKKRASSKQPLERPISVPNEEELKRLYREHGAFFDITEYRKPIRTGNILVEEFRPFFSPFDGGLSTLTHHAPLPEKRKGFLGLFGG